MDHRDSRPTDEHTDVPGKPAAKGPLVAASFFLPAVILLVIAIIVILFLVG